MKPRIVIPTVAPEAYEALVNLEKYNASIKQADEKLKERKLDEAKSFYNQALVIKKALEVFQSFYLFCWSTVFS